MRAGAGDRRVRTTPTPLCGNRSGNVHRSRHTLNADTIREMHLAMPKGVTLAEALIASG
jgi:hypothetical protein